MTLDKIGFGGGCHWCTEAVFQTATGVLKVDQGWIASVQPHDSFSEAIIVHFNPEKTDINTLISIHLKTHSCTSDHSMRDKYRSAVYTFNEEQISIVEQVLVNLQTEYDQPIVTQVLNFVSFKENKEEYQNYYLKNPEKAFCVRYIEPKLRMLESIGKSK